MDIESSAREEAEIVNTGRKDGLLALLLQIESCDEDSFEDLLDSMLLDRLRLNHSLSKRAWTRLNNSLRNALVRTIALEANDSQKLTSHIRTWDLSFQGCFPAGQIPPLISLRSPYFFVVCGFIRDHNTKSACGACGACGARDDSSHNHQIQMPKDLITIISNYLTLCTRLHLGGCDAKYVSKWQQQLQNGYISRLNELEIQLKQETDALALKSAKSDKLRVEAILDAKKVKIGDVVSYIGPEATEAGHAFKFDVLARHSTQNKIHIRHRCGHENAYVLPDDFKKYDWIDLDDTNNLSKWTLMSDPDSLSLIVNPFIQKRKLEQKISSLRETLEDKSHSRLPCNDDIKFLVLNSWYHKCWTGSLYDYQASIKVVANGDDNYNMNTGHIDDLVFGVFGMKRCHRGREETINLREALERFAANWKGSMDRSTSGAFSSEFRKFLNEEGLKREFVENKDNFSFCLVKPFGRGSVNSSKFQDADSFHACAWAVQEKLKSLRNGETWDRCVVRVQNVEEDVATCTILIKQSRKCVEEIRYAGIQLESDMEYAVVAQYSTCRCQGGGIMLEVEA